MRSGAPASVRLQHHDDRAIWHLAEEAVRVRDPLQLGETIVRGVGRLIDCESASYNVFRDHGAPILVRSQPVTVRDGAAIFAAHYKEHPLVRQYSETGDTTAHRIWDLTTRSAFHRLAIYNEYYRPAAIEHQLAVSLQTSDSSYTAVALNRPRGRDFSAHDRDALTALGPLLARAYENAVIISRLESERRVLTTALFSIRRAVVALGRDGTIVMASGVAEKWLDRYFGWRGGRRLPAPLAEWVATQSLPGGRTSFALGDTWLRIATARDESGTTLLLLREDAGASDRRNLASLGLSSRETDVLAWIVQGKSDAEIAVILGLSPRTVQHHVGHLLVKLGVESRTAAAMLAYQSQDR